MKDRGYEKDEGHTILLLDENAMDGHVNLYHYSKTFCNKYKIMFGIDGENAIWPFTDVTWTIWYADGSKEWGRNPDVIFQPNPHNGIRTIENHAELAYKEKASLFR